MVKKLPAQITDSEPAHSDVGASVIKRIIKCPGSRALCAKAGKEPPRKESAEGSVAHEVASDHLLDPENPKLLPSRRLGEIIRQEGFDIEVDEEMVDGVMVYVRYVRKIIKVNGLLPHHIFIEKKVRIPSRHKGDSLFGRTDAMFHIPLSHLHVGDLKYGKGVIVDVEENPQCLYYGLGGYFSLDKSQRELIDHVVLAIIQPRIAEGDFNGISEFAAPKKRLKEFHEEVLAAVDLSREENAPLQADGTGEDWCKFCSGKSICPAYKAMLIDTLQTDFDDIETEDDVKKLLPRPHDMPIEQLVQFLNIFPALQNYGKAMHQHAYGLAQSSPKAAKALAELGWVLVKRRSNRRWRDAKMAEKVLKRVLEENAYAKPKILSPTAAQKAIKKLEKEGLLEQAIAWNKLIEKPDNGYALAKQKKGGKQQRVSAEAVMLADFDDVDVDALDSAN